MQTPQDLDATHRDELFPIDESSLTSSRAWALAWQGDAHGTAASCFLVRQGVDALRPPSFSQLRRSGGGEEGVEISVCP
jgi:hypothetical protein